MIELCNVTKRYGALTAIHNVSLTIKRGEILGYLGPNGSGKSTTVRMLAGLTAPSRGHILFDGRDIQQDLASYKAVVGYVPEEAHVYTHLTAPEYLTLCGRLRGLPKPLVEEKVRRFLAVLRLDADQHATLASFSKGMRQKVLLAAALLHNPTVLILDEPVSGLDVSAALMLRAVVRALAAEGRIVFYSSHELDTIERISSRVVILRSGQVVADGSAHELRQLMNSRTLEDVFAQLAVRDDVEALALDLVTAARL
jgi:ABC-2 type transport system ATP-binding protein